MILIIVILLCIAPIINEGFDEVPLKYVNLVLYSENEEYNQMKEITQQYYKKFENVKTIYYKFDNNIVDKYRMEGNVLKIKGTENYLPGILEKSIKAMEYVAKNENEFDYLVRSNISTIVDFGLLDKELKKNPIEYGGGLINILQMIDKNGGIVDDTYFGLEYVSGTAIIFSKKILEQLVNKKNKLNYKIIDDVAIGLFMRDEIKKPAQQVKEGSFVVVSDKMNDKISKKSYIFYRNRNDNRKTDVKNMRAIVDYLT